MERDRPDPWIYDPQRDHRPRWITMPMQRGSVFVFFSLLAVPGAGLVILKSQVPLETTLGVMLGATVAYVLMDVMAYFVRCDNQRFQVLPWPPLGGIISSTPRLGWISRGFSRLFSWIAWKLPFVPIFVFEPQKDPSAKIPRLRDDHFYAAWSLLGVALVYFAFYRGLKPFESGENLFHLSIESFPPAAFLYALLLPLIWLVSALWAYLRRYRITLLLAIAIGILLYGIGSTRLIESTIGGPSHTYNVVVAPITDMLYPHDVIRPLRALRDEHGRKPNLIIVAASGGGILAAGWTTTVLCKLQESFPQFRRELRLISAVSGGAVGSAYYVGGHRSSDDPSPLPCEGRKGIIDSSIQTSLAVSAYGFAFPDFRRMLLPIWTDEDFDRGHLLEQHWRAIANLMNGRAEQDVVLLSDWREDIKAGRKPAVIFNATVMETGERIAITPLSTLQRQWSGWKRGNFVVPERFHHAKTLSEFLVYADTHSIDVWTAARLSASFSYVSPAARASFVERQAGYMTRGRLPDPTREPHGLLHLIDGGYHDNFGVASALDWLAAVLEHEPANDLPFARIALVEIRAKPESSDRIAASAWNAAWLGPLLGLMNSWDLAQTASDDTAVNRTIERFRRLQEFLGIPVTFESFVFVPETNGPHSWHLSQAQKQIVQESWQTETNRTTFQAFNRKLN
ncbi:MAG: hypothetical protein ACT4OO_04435, partial [Nitrospiraceae bacterium]